MYLSRVVGLVSGRPSQPGPGLAAGHVLTWASGPVFVHPHWHMAGPGRALSWVTQVLSRSANWQASLRHGALAAAAASAFLEPWPYSTGLLTPYCLVSESSCRRGVRRSKVEGGITLLAWLCLFSHWSKKINDVSQIKDNLLISDQPESSCSQNDRRGTAD